MKDPVKILFVEDIPSDAELVRRQINKDKIHFIYKLVEEKSDFIDTIHSFSPDIIISDYSLPRFSGFEALKIRNDIAPDIPFILVTGSINEEVAVECMKAGADDYVLKENLSRLVPAIHNSIRKIEMLKKGKKSDEDLKNFLSLTEATLESIHNGILVVNLDGSILKANAKFTKMWHIPEEVMASCWDKDLLDYVKEQLVDPEEFIHKVSELYNKPDSESKDLISFKDGRIFERNSRPIYLESKAMGRVWSFLDITERIQAEESINHERRMLRTLIDNLPDPIYVLDKNGRKVIANKADLKNIGCKTEDEVLGKTDIELFPGQIGIRGHADNEIILKTGEAIIEREEDFVDMEGSRRWLLTTKIPLRNNDGIITGLVGIGHDITNRKNSDRALRESFAFNESLLKTIPFGMDIVDEKGTILFQSDNFKQLFGENTIGKKCWEIYRDDLTQCSDCPLIKGITIGETESYESHGVLGGRIFEINHTGLLYQGKKAMLEIFQDITDRKVNEAELIAAKEKAEESDRLKTAFLHNISHEIRTPMNAIVGFSALLEDSKSDPVAQQSYIETIMQSSNHLLAIISDIVDISNLEANLVKITKSEINVNNTLKSIWNQFQPKALEKKIEFKCVSELSDSDANILADSTKLTQVITNLISNALKFTDNGVVAVNLKFEDDFLNFTVSDTGIGIAAEFQDRIFERFFQVHNSTSRIYEGTGLGLAISRAYVELMGGTINLSSKPGQGTTFMFSIPYQKQQITISDPYKETFMFNRKIKILIAEDVDSNFKLLTYFLKGTNADIIRAENGKEAVERCFAENDLDLILMDVKMPVMDGYSAVRLIRENNIRIPIIAQTAYFEDRMKALEAGCSGFISKPFDKKGLLQIVSSFIQ